MGDSDEDDEGGGFGDADESDEEDAKPEAPKEEPKKTALEPVKEEKEEASGGDDGAKLKQKGTKKKKKAGQKKSKKIKEGAGIKKDAQAEGGGFDEYAKQHFREGTSSVYQHPGLSTPLKKPVTMIPGAIDEASTLLSLSARAVVARICVLRLCWVE